MSSSARAARMRRHHQRHGSGASLNMVSLMDIFTILVFFLLVNSGETEVLPSARDLALPLSTAQQLAEESVVVMVTPDNIMVQGAVIASVADVLKRPEVIIPELSVALRAQSDRVMEREAGQSIEEREVTVMADKALPYSLLKKIMATCTDAEYGRLSLAVLQKEPEGGL